MSDECPVCGAAMKRDRHVWLLRCEGCGLLGSRLRPMIPNERSKSALDEEARLEGLAAVRHANNEAIIGLLRQSIGSGGRLLDVGAGLGFFLQAAKRAGFEVLGVEPDANVVEEARRGGFEVRHGYFPDCIDPDEKFGVIVFNDVLEHVVDLPLVMSGIRDHLASGGLAVLNSPDRRGIFYRIADRLDRLGIHGPFDRLWQRGVPSPHRWYFTKEDLFRLGAKYGLAESGTVRLKTLSREGLAKRIFYFRNQNRLLSIASYVGAFLLIPSLRFLPSDLSVAVVRKR